MTSTEETTQTVVHVELPKAMSLAGAMLECGAVILLDSDPTSETGELWLGEVLDFEQHGDRVTIFMDYDQVVEVEVMKAQVAINHEADPQQAVVRALARSRHDG